MRRCLSKCPIIGFNTATALNAAAAAAAATVTRSISLLMLLPKSNHTQT